MWRDNIRVFFLFQTFIHLEDVRFSELLACNLAYQHIFLTDCQNCFFYYQNYSNPFYYNRLFILKPCYCTFLAYFTVETKLLTRNRTREYMGTISELWRHWRLSTILKSSNKSVWSNDFWFVKVCIFWKCIQYTIHWDKIQILKKFPSDKINSIKNALFFLSQAPSHHSFTFNFRFLYQLRHKVRLSKAVTGIFHFRKFKNL